MSRMAGEKSIAICFGQYFAHSDKFDAVFDQGMALVEKTARYLDGEGRKEAKSLKPPLSVIYATESMRLTTRLLSLSSWLLTQRSLKRHEISLNDAHVKRKDLSFRPFGRISHIKHLNQLPKRLQDLIRESYALSQHIHQIDRALQGETTSVKQKRPHTNPVNDQQQLIEMRFGKAEQLLCNPM